MWKGQTGRQQHCCLHTFVGKVIVAYVITANSVGYSFTFSISFVCPSVYCSVFLSVVLSIHGWELLLYQLTYRNSSGNAESHQPRDGSFQWAFNEIIQTDACFYLSQKGMSVELSFSHVNGRVFTITMVLSNSILLTYQI